MGFRDLNGESNVAHIPSAVFAPVLIEGAGPWTVTARVVDASTIRRSPAEDVAVDDVVATFYSRAGVRRVATYRVASVESAAGNVVRVVLETLDAPPAVAFPYGLAAICATIGDDYLAVVEGEPLALTVAKLNNAIAGISNGGTTWTQTVW